MKTSKIRYFAVALITVAFMSFIACQEESPAVEDFDITGDYHFTNNNTTYDWYFKNDKSFEILWFISTAKRSYTGSWSVSGDEITIQLEALEALGGSSETFTASRNGKNVTLVSKNSTTSTTFVLFGMASKTLTMTEGKTYGEGNNESETKTYRFNDFNFTYKIVNNSSITLVHSADYDPRTVPLNLVLPSTIEDLPVTVIGDSALDNRSPTPKTKTLVIPPSISKIEAYNFDSWDNLEKITIGANVDIANNAFSFFRLCYKENGEKAGTYILDDYWIRQ